MNVWHVLALARDHFTLIRKYSGSLANKQQDLDRHHLASDEVEGPLQS